MIRRATQADSAEIARIIAPQGFEIDGDSVAANWNDWEAEGNFALVIGEPGALLGVITLHKMVVLHRPHPVGRITSLGVDPEAQGKGLGRQLVEAAEAELQSLGCEVLEVTSHQRRKDAHAFYRHLGFEPTSFRFARFFMVLVMLLATAGAGPAQQTEANIDLHKLHPQLQKAAVDGYVLIHETAIEYSSAERARNGTWPTRGVVKFDTTRLDYHSKPMPQWDRYYHWGSPLIFRRVLADHGDVVEVQNTDQELPEAVGHGGKGADYRYEMRTFVRKCDLVPVVARPYTRSFADGTSITLHPGSAVGIPLNGAGTQRAVSVQQLHFAFEVPDEYLALSYQAESVLVQPAMRRPMLPADVELVLGGETWGRSDQIRFAELRTPLQIKNHDSGLLISMARNGIELTLIAKCKQLVEPYQPQIDRPILTAAFDRPPRWQIRIPTDTKIYWHDGRVAGRTRMATNKFTVEPPGATMWGEVYPEMMKEEPFYFRLEDVEVIDNKPYRKADEPRFETARKHGLLAAEGLRRCRDYLNGWLKLADPDSGLIPRNRRDLYWNAQDAAADNYPFMVLSSALVDRELFLGRMTEMLQSETRLTSRLGALPDTYDFAKKGFAADKVDLNRLMFGASEYIKDGLLPLTEILGKTAWSDRMISILDDMWKHAPVETPYGKIVSKNVEVNGEMLQALSRVYFMTGDEKYLEWAIRLGDYYLLGDQHPTRNFTNLRLRDHGCEIVSGLCELYVAVSFARPFKQIQYRDPIHEMLDRILEVGRNEHGLFYNSINPQTGKATNAGVADTWGYTLNGFYAVYLVDGTKAYQAATLQALQSIDPHYRSFDWERGSSDGYADAIESALNLYNREPVASAADWVDSEIQVMWSKQKADGIIEGWHGDGNFARTTIMYCLWKSQGVHASPWREDLVLGADRKGDELFLTLTAADAWSGKLVFDYPRHQEWLNLPMDWPRINQFPEWFTVEMLDDYILEDVDAKTHQRHRGASLVGGAEVSLEKGQTLRLRITSAK